MSASEPSPPSRGIHIAFGAMLVLAGTAVYFLTIRNFFLSIVLPVGAVLLSLVATRSVFLVHNNQLGRLVNALINDPHNPNLLDELEEKLLTMPLREVALTLQDISRNNQSADRLMVVMRQGGRPVRERIRSALSAAVESRSGNSG